MVSLEAERVRQRGQCIAADCSVLSAPQAQGTTARWVDDQTQKAEKPHYSLRGLK